MSVPEITSLLQDPTNKMRNLHQISKFDSSLLTAPKALKDFLHQYNCMKEIFDLEESHDKMDENPNNENTSNNNFFSKTS